jgi:adenylosuccinate synthase
MIAAGALIDLGVLEAELLELDLDLSRVRVDRNAMIIEESDKQDERRLCLRERLSSTLCGVGSAVARRALRGEGVRTAADAANSIPWLQGLIANVSAEVNTAVDAGQKVLVEGTQGFGLSLYHTAEYPKATSRDTTAAAFLSEVGLSPLLVSEVVVVFRTFPIRVSGRQAGALKDEITWETLRIESRSPLPIEERTSVTNMQRRIGRFDWDLAKQAVIMNRPTKLAINGLDYLDYANRGVVVYAQLTDSAKLFLARAQQELGVPVSIWATGPQIEQCYSETRVLKIA